LTQESDLSQCVLHEFGHALGLIHEHQHPFRPFILNRNAVIAHYQGEPYNWPEDSINLNVLNQLNRASTNHMTSFDPESIMVYSLPDHLFKQKPIDYQNNNYNNTTLSRLDILLIQNLYASPNSYRPSIPTFAPAASPIPGHDPTRSTPFITKEALGIICGIVVIAAIVVMNLKR